MGKNLKINTMICDSRKVTEDFLQQYEKVDIDTMLLCTTEESMQLMSRYNVSINAMNIEKLDNGVELEIINGSHTIKATVPVARKTSLIVNGKLIVEKDALDSLEDYIKIIVNGGALYPQSLAGVLASRLLVNGKAAVYPDEATLIQGDLELDRRFISKTEAGTLYYVNGKVSFMNREADYSELIKKEVRIQTGRAVVRESTQDLAEQILVGTPKWTVVPDNCEYCRKDVVLDDSFYLKNGSRVYVDGSLTAEDESVLGKMEFLQVSGRVLLNERAKEAFLSVCNKFGDLLLYSGTLLQQSSDCVIEAGMLEEEPEKIYVVDCVNVRLEDGITKEQIKEKLRITGCVNVICPPELLAVVRLIAKDCVNIVSSLRKAEADPDCMKIDTMFYTM